MSRTYTLFAYRHDDDDCEHDVHRVGLPDWRLEQAVRWAADRGFDSILISHTPDDKPSSTPACTHHVCRDPVCPGGCT